MNPPGAAYETRHGDNKIATPSNRRFGLLIACVFAIVGLLPLWRGHSLRTWPLTVAGLLTIVTLVVPQFLTPFNRYWWQLGLVMHRVSDPVVTSLLYYAVLTPFALLARLVGKLPMERFKPDRAAATYWISRTDDSATRMDRQF